jgi:hypothetical protein
MHKYKMLMALEMDWKFQLPGKPPLPTSLKHNAGMWFDGDYCCVAGVAL